MQFDFGTIVASTKSGSVLATDLNQWRDAEESNHAGTTRPSYATPGMIWINTSFDPPHLMYVYDSLTDFDLGTLSDSAFSELTGTIKEWAGVDLPDGYDWCDGTALSRSTYDDLYQVITKLVTCDSHSNTGLTNVSEDLRNKGLIGAKVEGSGIPSNTTITAIGSSTITLSQATTTTVGSLSIRIFPHGNGNGSTTFNKPDRRGTVGVGRDDMGGSAASRVTTGGSGYDATKLGTVIGTQAVTLTTAQMPTHTHTASSSGTTSSDGSHTHTGTTDTTGSHSHNVQIDTRNNGETGAGDRLLKFQTGGSGTNSTLSTSAVNVVNAGNHSHNLTIDSGGAHTHILSLSTTVNNAGSGDSHPNVSPSTVTNFIIKL